METFCDKILGIDKAIRFVMLVDQKGEVQCWASRVKLEFSEDLVKQLGGVRTIVVTGIAENLAKYLGKFEFSVFKYQKAYFVHVEVEKKHAIFTIEKYPTAKLLENIKKAVLAK
jgi:aspartyl/asparaginyl-tRNA synthetase